MQHVVREGRKLVPSPSLPYRVAPAGTLIDHAPVPINVATISMLFFYYVLLFVLFCFFFRSKIQRLYHKEMYPSLFDTLVVYEDSSFSFLPRASYVTIKN